MDQEEESLGALFDKALVLHNEILDSKEDTNSEPFQDKVKKHADEKKCLTEEIKREKRRSVIDKKNMVAVINHQKEEHEEEIMLLKNQKHRHGIEKNRLIHQLESEFAEEGATLFETRLKLQEKDEKIRMLNKRLSLILRTHIKKE